MKFYETTNDEYITTVNKFNIHNELESLYKTCFPRDIKHFENIIVYGPVGSGKYSQVLYFLKNYSPTELKYEKKMTIQSEKQNYTFHISDIHYEIDMSFLGCNSKNLWHDIFFQIVDIISVKQEKIGIIVCKNFHMIHNELLDIFYSYVQQFNDVHMNIQVKFVILTEHMSFIPSNIVNACAVLNIQKPNKETLKEMMQVNKKKIQQINKKHAVNEMNVEKHDEILNIIDTNTVINMKEIHSFSLIENAEDLPKDTFNIICDQIINEMTSCEKINFITFRESLYDILTYNLDVVECVWYILTHFILANKLESQDISDVMNKTYIFLTYFNNNYRPIYHLESIMFYLITKIIKHGNGNGNDKRKSIKDIADTTCK